MVHSMKVGSVTVDLAAATGGNIATTRADEVCVPRNRFLSFRFVVDGKPTRLRRAILYLSYLYRVRLCLFWRCVRALSGCTALELLVRCFLAQKSSGPREGGR